MAALNKPIKLPRWGTDQTNEVEPGETQKDTGWLFEQIPPSSFQNFLSRVTFDWVAWIDERLDDDIDGGGITENGVAFTDPLTTEPSGSRGVTKIRLLNPVGGSVRISALAITNNIGGASTIEATGALFVAGGVLLNDLVELVGTNSNDGFYIVSSIVDEDNITVNRLNGGGGAFAAEASIQGTVKLYAKGGIRGELIAPGGWKLAEKVSGEGVILKKNPGVGATIVWIFPDDLPSTKSFLSIDENGQLTAGVPSEVRTIGDGISSFGDFEGTDKTPFTDAIADLPAEGGTILVGEGTYTFTTPLVIAKANVKIIGVLGYQETIIVGDGAAFQAHNVATIETAVDDVRLQGLTVTQTEGPFSNWCIFLKLGAEHCVVTECFGDHQYAGADGSEIADQQAIVIEGSKNWVFRNRTNFHNKGTETAKAGIRVGLRNVAGSCEGNQVFFNQAFCTENGGDSSEAAVAVMVMATDADFGTTITSPAGTSALTIVVQDNVIIGNHNSDGGNCGSVINMSSGSVNAGSNVTLTNNVISGNSGQFNASRGIDKHVHGVAGTLKNDENIVEGNSLRAEPLTDNGNKLVWAENYVSTTTPGFTAKQLDMSDFNGNG